MLQSIQITCRAAGKPYRLGLARLGDAADVACPSPNKSTNRYGASRLPGAWLLSRTGRQSARESASAARSSISSVTFSLVSEIPHRGQNRRSTSSPWPRTSATLHCLQPTGGAFPIISDQSRLTKLAPLHLRLIAFHSGTSRRRPNSFASARAITMPVAVISIRGSTSKLATASILRPDTRRGTS